MASTSQKLIAVVGGTGNLGSSVAISLQQNPEFQVRVLSRNPSLSKAQRLITRGIEVVQADNWKADELLAAFTDCWGLFINIDSDAPNFKQQIGPTELEMGRIIIDAAVKAGVQHMVHASLPAASKLTDGKIPLVAFDDKAAISEYALLPGKFTTASIVSAGWFLENAFDPKYEVAFGGFATSKDAEGYLTWQTPPMGNNPESVPFLAVTDDYGDIVHGVFLDPEKWSSRYLHAVSESMSFAGLCETFQQVTGKPSRYKKVEGNNGLQANDKFKTKEVNGLFDLMHAINGNFFNGIPTIHEDSRVLKEAGCQARGEGPQQELMTCLEFFRKYAL